MRKQDDAGSPPYIHAITDGDAVQALPLSWLSVALRLSCVVDARLAHAELAHSWDGNEERVANVACVRLRKPSIGNPCP
jgi:hypothetical protein